MKKMPRTKTPDRLKTSLRRVYAERSSYIMIAPFMIAFFVFTVIPVIAAIVLSFTDFNMLQTPNWVGFSNYETMFLNDDVFIIAVKNTLNLLNEPACLPPIEKNIRLSRCFPSSE